MKQRYFLVFALPLTWVLLVATVSAEDITYYSPEGKIISKAEYDEIIMRRKAVFEELKMALNKATKSETEKSKRPNLNGKIRKSTSPLVQQGIYDANGRPTDDPSYLDSKGRPLFDSKGRMIIYAETESDMNANEVKVDFLQAMGRQIKYGDQARYE